MIAEKGTSGLIEYLHQKADKLGSPFSGTFELTPACNMSCNMCYVRKTPEIIKTEGKRLRTVEEWISLAKQAHELGTLLLLLTGGEPFTYPGFRELYMELRKMGFVISINTNGTLIDEETADWLALNSPQRVNVTLYGSSDETYTRLCHNPEGYTKAKRAVEMMQDRGINVKLNCSVTPENADDLEEVISYSDERKLILQANSYMFPPLRRDRDSVGVNQRFSPKECAETEAKIRLLQRGEENLRTYCESVEKCHPHEEDAFLDCEGDAVRCRAGKSAYWINWEGKMLMCAMVDEPETDPFKDGFEKAWEQLKNKTKQIRLPAECASCEAKDICRSCAAMIYTETGSYDRKPQYRCDLIREVPEACRKLLKEKKMYGIK